jgi:chorismate synthase
MTETTIAIKGRHDPCIAVRAVPVVEAVTATVILIFCWRKMQMELSEIRDKIDAIDGPLLDLFLEG